MTEFFFADFTEQEYEQNLFRAQKHWTLVPVSEADFSINRMAIWRHDVDVSPQRAVALARIEHAHNVRSTFYFMIRSEFYNVFEEKTRAPIQEIIQLGHEVGIHFSPHAYPSLSSKDPIWESQLQYEDSILRNEFGISTASFSFHNPTVGNWHLLEGHRYGGLINAYSADLRQAYYCSDSNGYWRHERLPEVLESGEHKHIYILTHPEWWVPSVCNPDERIQRAIHGRAGQMQQSWNALVDSVKRKVNFYSS